MAIRLNNQAGVAELVQSLPSAYSKEALARKRASLFRLDKTALQVERFSLEESKLIDHLVQMNMGEAALQVEVQHFAEKMLHGQNVSAVEFGGAYRAPGAEG